MTRSVLLAATLCSVVSSATAQTPLSGTQVAQVYQNPRQPEQTIRYLLSLPSDYGTGKKSWPVLVFLHGAGERGSDLAAVKKHGPPKLVEQQGLPFIVISPQCPRDTRWSEPPVFGALQGMLSDVLRRYSGDPEHVYLTGLSMGGHGTWFWASEEPYRFAAILPICGGADAAWGPNIQHLPIWVFHGAKDGAVPLSESETIVEAIRTAGGDPKFTVYPDAGHDSWTATYANPDIYTWMLAQTKQPAPEVPLAAPKP